MNVRMSSSSHRLHSKYMCGAPNRSLLQTGPILENCEQLELFALTRFTVFLAYFSGLPVYSTTSY